MEDHGQGIHRGLSHVLPIYKKDLSAPQMGQRGLLSCAGQPLPVAGSIHRPDLPIQARRDGRKNTRKNYRKCLVLTSILCYNRSNVRKNRRKLEFLS